MVGNCHFKEKRQKLSHLEETVSRIFVFKIICMFEGNYYGKNRYFKSSELSHLAENVSRIFVFFKDQYHFGLIFIEEWNNVI